MTTSFSRLRARRSPFCLAALLAAVLVSAPPPAAAAPRPEGRPSAEALAQARSHFERGVTLYEEDDCRAALIEFTRAYEYAPHWQVLYNIGQAHYQLRDYANALRTLERYLTEAGDRAPAERRAHVVRELDELRGRVAHVVVVANVDGAEVAIDDAPIGATPFASPVLIGAGRHRATVTKRGYTTVARTFDLAGGDEARLAFELSDVTPSARPRSEGTPGAPSAGARAPSAAPAIASFVVAGTGLAVGTAFGVVAMGDKARLDADCVNKVCPAGRQGGIDAYARDGLVATLGFGVGATAALVGVVLLLRDGRPTAEVASATSPARAPRTPRVTPWLGAGGGGLAGTF